MQLTKYGIILKNLILLFTDISGHQKLHQDFSLHQWGTEGIFMEGEILIPLKEQEEMIKVFEEVDLPYEFYVNKGIGHAVPQDLPDKLNKALSFIHNRQCVL